MVFYLVYTSLPREEMTPEILDDIAISSIRNNKEKGITGMLLGIEGRYLQYLEGKKEDVLELFERLKFDGRHHEMHKWIQGNADERIFTEWSMASWMLSNKELSNLSAAKELKNFLKTHEEGDYPSQRFLEMMQNLLLSWIEHEPERADRLRY